MHHPFGWHFKKPSLSQRAPCLARTRREAAAVLKVLLWSRHLELFDRKWINKQRKMSRMWPAAPRLRSWGRAFSHMSWKKRINLELVFSRPWKIRVTGGKISGKAKLSQKHVSPVGMYLANITSTFPSVYVPNRLKPSHISNPPFNLIWPYIFCIWHSTLKQFQLREL